MQSSKLPSRNFYSSSRNPAPFVNTLILYYYTFTSHNLYLLPCKLKIQQTEGKRWNNSYRCCTNIRNENPTSHWSPLQSQPHLKSHRKLTVSLFIRGLAASGTARFPVLFSICEYPTPCIKWSKLYMNWYHFLPTEVASLEQAAQSVILVNNFH